MKAWLKGGLWGLVVGIILTIIGYFTTFISTYWGSSMIGRNFGNITLILFLYPAIFLAILGILIGLLRDNYKKSSPTKKGLFISLPIAFIFFLISDMQCSYAGRGCFKQGLYFVILPIIVFPIIGWIIGKIISKK